MSAAEVKSLAGEFRAVHQQMRDRIESSRLDEIDTLVKKRQVIVDRLFDHIRKKADFEPVRK
jgi:hypothetical protein